MSRWVAPLGKGRWITPTSQRRRGRTSLSKASTVPAFQRPSICRSFVRSPRACARGRCQKPQNQSVCDPHRCTVDADVKIWCLAQSHLRQKFGVHIADVAVHPQLLLITFVTSPDQWLQCLAGDLSAEPAHCILDI